MNQSRLFIALISFMVGYYVASIRAPVPPRVEFVERERVVVDTIYLENIAPTRIERDTITIMRDTIIYAPRQIYTFGKEGEWEAKVSGKEVTMESMWLAERSHFTTTTQLVPPRWELQGLTAVAPQSCWMGIMATHNFNNNKVASLAVGYDIWRQSPHIEARIGIVLFRR